MNQLATKHTLFTFVLWFLYWPPRWQVIFKWISKFFFPSLDCYRIYSPVSQAWLCGKTLNLQDMIIGESFRKKNWPRPTFLNKNLLEHSSKKETCWKLLCRIKSHLLETMKSNQSKPLLSWLLIVSTFLLLKVTVDLQGCLPKNHSYARRLCFNHRKVYIIVKQIKCKIRKNKHF